MYYYYTLLSVIRDEWERQYDAFFHNFPTFFFATTSYSTSIFNWSRSQSTTTVTPFLLIMVPFYSIFIMQMQYVYRFFSFAFLEMSSADFCKTNKYTNNATITKRTTAEQLSDHLKFACYVSKSWLATSFKTTEVIRT